MNKWRKALFVAAEEAFESEVVETQMVSIIIGKLNEFSSREDWIDSKVCEWLEVADTLESKSSGRM